MPGIGIYFFAEKSKQKLSATPFALKDSALAISSLPQKPRPNGSEFNGFAWA